MSRNTARNLRFAFALAAFAVAVTRAAEAKDPIVNEVTRHLESLDIAPAVEHRLAILHPIVARVVPEKRGEAVRLAGTASPDLLAFGAVSEASRARAEVLSFAPEPVVFAPGDVVRGSEADFVVTHAAFVPAGTPSDVRVMRVSRGADPEPRTAEARMLGPVLPSALRYLVLTGHTGPAVRETCEKWAGEVRLSTPRRSPADLGLADVLATRVADYRKSLASLPVPSAESGQELVGCVFLLDGAFASMETFGTGALFAAAWPRLLDGIAVEAAFAELREGLLAEDLADPADPDRFLTDLKKRLLGVFGARIESSEVPEGARRLEIGIEGAVAQALVVGEGRVTHFVLITDPARRAEKRTDESPDPTAAARKARPTEEERRLIERRGGGAPVPVPPQPPTPAPAPK